MQFHIPQNIEIEDKIFGPLSLKQAIYVAGGAGGAYVVYRLIPYLFLAVPLIVGIGVLTWALAFYPVEKLGRPFIEILESAFKYALGDKLYTWKKTTREPKIEKDQEFIASKGMAVPTVHSGGLSSTSFDLGVKGPKKDDKDEVRESVTMRKL